MTDKEGREKEIQDFSLRSKSKWDKQGTLLSLASLRDDNVSLEFFHTELNVRYLKMPYQNVEGKIVTPKRSEGW